MYHLIIDRLIKQKKSVFCLDFCTQVMAQKINSAKEIIFMSLLSYSSFGYEGTIITVETDLRKGIPSFDIVGLSDGIARETGERIVSAFRNSSLDFPSERVLSSLSPSDIKKESASFDLPLALDIYNQTLSEPFSENVGVMGELQLNGKIRNVRGIFAFIQNAYNHNIRKFILPLFSKETVKNLSQKILDDVEFLFVSDLKECTEKYRDFKSYEKIQSVKTNEINVSFRTDLDDNIEIEKGYSNLVRALMIAISGKHNILSFGDLKGSLMRKLQYALLPDLTVGEMETVSRIYSLSELDYKYSSHAPVRTPHQTASIEGMCGGGSYCRPGEISLSHNGILFLDEAHEFKSSVLQMLRVPLEIKSITLSRAGRSTVFPADFQLHLNTLPCPCGNYGSKDKICLCSAKAVNQYWKKFSSPLLDRIEIRTETRYDGNDNKIYSLEELREGIVKAYSIQRKRKAFNGKLSPQEIMNLCKIDEKTQNYLDIVIERKNLSQRIVNNILKVSLTIANINGRNEITLEDLKESVNLCTSQGYELIDLTA